MIPVNRRAIVAGLKAWPKVVGTNYHVDLAELGEADLGSSPKGLPPGVVLPRDAPIADVSKLRWLWVAGAVVLVSTLAWFVTRQGMKRT